MRNKTENVIISEFAPGSYSLPIDHPALVLVTASGAGGGGGAGLSDDPKDESTDGNDGQETRINIYEQDALVACVCATGGVKGMAAERGRPGQNGGAGEQRSLFFTTDRPVRLEIIVGHGGRGGFVTGNKTTLDGQTGGQGRAIVIIVPQ